MMASSQIEIRTTFGCVAHKAQQDRRLQNNADHHQRHGVDFTDLWVHRPQWKTTTSTEDDEDDNNDRNHNGIVRDDKAQSHQHHHNKKKWARAREFVFTCDDACSADVKGGSRAPENPNVNRGVSSLVQRWKGLEAKNEGINKSRVNISNNNIIPHHHHHQDVSTNITNDNNEAAVVSYSTASSTTSEYLEYYSDNSGPPSSCLSQKSNSCDSDRLKVADIIKKLTSEDRFGDFSCGGPESPSSAARRSLDNNYDHSKMCLNPPRIRGRQAYLDMLMQSGRDRHDDIQRLVSHKLVSKFSHRGRIQALLRTRFLRTGMDLNNCQCPKPTSLEPHQATRVAAKHFRERIIPCSSNEMENSENSSEVKSVNTLVVMKSENANQNQKIASPKSDPVEEMIHTEAPTTLSINHVPHEPDKTSETVHQLNAPHLPCCEESPSLTVMGKEPNKDSSNGSFVKSAESNKIALNNQHDIQGTDQLLDSTEIYTHKTEFEDSSNQKVSGNNYELGCDIIQPQSYNSEASVDLHNSIGTDAYWASDVSLHELEDEEAPHCDLQAETSSVWIAEVSRPQSDWEDLRQERYQEMLDPFYGNEEIRVLLQRKSVSSFLSSDLRDQIDRVMMCRTQGQQTIKESGTQQTKNKQQPAHEDRVEKREEVMSDEGVEDKAGEADAEYYDEYDEAESFMGQQCTEYADCMDQIISSPLMSWPQNEGHEIRDCSNQVELLSTQQSTSSNFHSLDNGHNVSYSSHPTAEMELIYDLRRHMEQIHQEVSELRKSIQCCMNMQVKLQHSITNEVSVALSRFDERKGKRSSLTSRGRCSICCKVQVDCVLYRCGHMCTCFKCSHELLWGSGKCPICGAPIIDIVRTYPTNSS